MKISSKYKILGGFGIALLLNFLSALLIWQALIENKVNGCTNVGMAILIILEIGALAFLITQCKYIVIENETIIFINPLLPFLRQTKNWSEYDYYQTVQEDSRGGTYEAIWLIKDNVIKNRISSFYYRNYSDLKREIKADYKGGLQLNNFQQIGCLLGMKIKS